MPVIPDPKKESFAQLCARGIPTIDAYTRAGYKRNTGNATALKKKDEVSKRIAELQYEMASSSHAELTEYLKISKLSPTFLITKLMETGNMAQEAGQFAVAAKCYKDIGGELFGMFAVGKAIPVDKSPNDVQSTTSTTINITNLNSALEGLGKSSTRIIEIEGESTVVESGGTGFPILNLEYEEQ